MKTKKPILLVVGGIPGAGKTSLAEKLSQDLGFAYINKDGILEQLWESFNWQGDQSEIPVFRQATFDLLYYFTEQIGRVNQSIIIEANFDNIVHSPVIIDLAKKTDFKIIYLHCHSESEIAFQRFKQRHENGHRHPLHPTRRTYQQYHKAFIAGRDERLKLPGQTLEIDLSDFSKFDYLRTLRKIKSLINLSSSS